MLVDLHRRKINNNPTIEVYDVYVGIRKILFPFIIEWYPDKLNLSEHEAKEYIWHFYCSVKGNKIITT